MSREIEIYDRLKSLKGVKGNGSERAMLYKELLNLGKTAIEIAHTLEISPIAIYQQIYYNGSKVLKTFTLEELTANGYVLSANKHFYVTKQGDCVRATTLKQLTPTPKHGKVNYIDENGITRGVTLQNVIWTTFNGEIPPKFRVFRSDKNTYALESLSISDGWKTTEKRGRKPKIKPKYDDAIITVVSPETV